MPLRRAFDYLVPEDQSVSALRPGVRLRVPFGPREVTAILLETVTESSVDQSQLRAATSVLDHEPLLSPSIIALCSWASDLLLTPLLTACAPGPDVEASSVAPAATQGPAMVVTANPEASNAGEEILRAGGTAVDAAIAIEAVLSLVEPQSSGLGGGGFMVYYHAADQSLEVYDGRETAPRGAHSDMFLQEDGSVYGYIEAKNSGLSIGVPGMVSLLSMAHADRGRLPRSAKPKAK